MTIDHKKKRDQFTQSPLAAEGKVQELKDVLQGKMDKGESGKSVEGLHREAGASAEELAKLSVALKEAQDMAQNEKDRAIRTLAEFENFRKRMQREQEEMIKYGNEKLLTELIPVYDHLEMTVHHARQQAKSNDPFVEGVEMVIKQFLGALEKFGVESLTGEGEKFDPHTQECIGSEHRDDLAEDYVACVHRRGFKLNGRVIRPAMVTVVKSETTERANPKNDEDPETFH